MPPRARKGPYVPSDRPAEPTDQSTSLLATDVEKSATSASLYGDHKARVSANLHHLHDRVRQQAYLGAIQQSMKNKTILHLGCGMGLLSMLAARSLAKLVVAVDTSAIVQHAAEVAKANNLTNLRFLHGSVSKKEVQLPEEKFDVILCEWVSTFVTNDTDLLKELLYCREHHLKEDGIVCPNQSSLHVAGITDYQYKLDTLHYWDNVYGFKMSAMKSLVEKEPSACAIPANQVMTNPSVVQTIKLADLKSEQDFAYSGKFSVTVTTKTTLHYLTFYVDCTFLHPANPGANFILPFQPGGNNPWTEVSAMLPEALPVNVGDIVTGEVKIVPRGQVTDITLAVSLKNVLVDHNSVSEHHFQY